MFTRIELNADIFAVWGRLAETAITAYGYGFKRGKFGIIDATVPPSAMQGCKL